jgi:hypothetical protein
MTMCPPGNLTDALWGVATTDAPDEASPPGDTGEAQDDVTIAENDTSNSSENNSRGACLPFWRITCMLVSAVVVRCFEDGDRRHNDNNGQQGDRWHDGGDGRHDDAAKRRRRATRQRGTMTATGGTTTARDGTATGGRTMATSGSTATARGSRAPGGTTTAMGDTARWHDNGDARRRSARQRRQAAQQQQRAAGQQAARRRRRAARQLQNLLLMHPGQVVLQVLPWGACCSRVKACTFLSG